MKSCFAHARFVALGLGVLVGVSSAGWAEEKKSRDQMVIEDRDGLRDNAAWIYNDFGKAREAAAAAGKPLMVVFRCIP